jgi:hypothetical protein
MAGRAKPLLPFKVESSPPSVYFNFEIEAQRASRLRKELDLPYRLTPIRCIGKEDPFYPLTLNIYRVSGLVNGIRAEWSVYIKDPSGKPRYLVVEAQSDNPSLDSVNLFTGSGEVTHSLERKFLVSSALATDGGRFTGKCRLSSKPRAVTAAPEWIAANDYIYWLNGVCDRTFYDSGLAIANIRLLKPADVAIEDSTRWGAMVLPRPRHVVVIENEIEFAISPWWNVDD